MDKVIFEFFDAFFNTRELRVPFISGYPNEMIASDVDREGWIYWKPIKGTLAKDKYDELERKFKVHFPDSFVAWHKLYFFDDGDISIVHLPTSLPNAPLIQIAENLNSALAECLIRQQLYPFASEANDQGPYIFDARENKENHEYPIRIYDQGYLGDIRGLSEVIFSSFIKMLECLTHFILKSRTSRNFDILPDFLDIDPEGAGKTGRNYWLKLAKMHKETFEMFGY